MDTGYCAGNSEESGIYRCRCNQKIMNRPSYKLKYRKAIPLEEMELVPDAHEAIISKEEFDSGAADPARTTGSIF